MVSRLLYPRPASLDIVVKTPAEIQKNALESILFCMKFWKKGFWFMRDSEEVVGWLKKAEADFQGAIYINRRRKNQLPDLVCYHSQQAAEKYLTAFLIYHVKPFPKTHDLILLLEMCLKYAPLLEFYKKLFEILNPYSVQFRYPGDEAYSYHFSNRKYCSSSFFVAKVNILRHFCKYGNLYRT
ncbi:MAG: HEPN domain-containing protein [bacterium]